MTPRIRTLISVAFAASLLAAEYSAAAEKAAKSSETDDLENYVCKDVMRMSGDDRIIALSILHGYTLGKKGTTKYVPAELTKITDNFTEHCLSNPNEKVLSAFAKVAK